MEDAMPVMEYRDIDPRTGELRTADDISVREYVRQVRGMTVEQFERRYGALCEIRETAADPDDYYRRLIVLRASEDFNE